jgi:hypothetical protein
MDYTDDSCMNQFTDGKCRLFPDNSKSDIDGDSLKAKSHAWPTSLAPTEASFSPERLLVVGPYHRRLYYLRTKTLNSNWRMIIATHLNSEPRANLSNRGNLEKNASDVKVMFCLVGAAIYFDKAWSLYHELACAIAFLD